jgi:hypothetical protein
MKKRSPKKSHIKIEDTVDLSGSRVHRYWDSAGFKDFYKQFRKGLALPKALEESADSPLKIQEAYKLRGFQFGNWLSNEDRYNYLAAIYICLYDLNKVLKFKGNNLGLDKNLIISFGSRGSSGALAHYEPTTNAINMTRYKRMDSINRQRYAFGQPPIELTKMERFVYTGGVGSFAHEYGHFLDYFFGANYDIYSRSWALTGGTSTNPTRINWAKKHNLRILTEDLMQKIYWKNEKTKTPSAYYQRLKTSVKGEYWHMRNEIFARAFEQYITYKLKEVGIYNTFLSKKKYVSTVYIPAKEFKAVVPYFDRLIAEMRKYF